MLTANSHSQEVQENCVHPAMEIQFLENLTSYFMFFLIMSDDPRVVPSGKTPGKTRSGSRVQNPSRTTSKLKGVITNGIVGLDPLRHLYEHHQQ